VTTRRRGELGEVVRSVVLVLSWIAAGMARDLTLALMAGTVMLFVGAWSLAEELSSPRVDVREKRGIVVLYALLMAAPCARLLIKPLS
jgi:hypothetical protein